MCVCVCVCVCARARARVCKGNSVSCWMANWIKKYKCRLVEGVTGCLYACEPHNMCLSSLVLKIWQKQQWNKMNPLWGYVVTWSSTSYYTTMILTFTTCSIHQLPIKNTKKRLGCDINTLLPKSSLREWVALPDYIVLLCPLRLLFLYCCRRRVM